MAERKRGRNGHRSCHDVHFVAGFRSRRERRTGTVIGTGK